MPQNALPSSVPRFYASTGADYSQSVPTSVTTLLPVATRPRNYVLIVNIGPPTGPILWVSWFNTPGISTPGSIAIGPYGNSLGYPSTIEFGLNGGVVPQTNLLAISDGGAGATSPCLVTATVF